MTEDTEGPTGDVLPPGGPRFYGREIAAQRAVVVAQQPPSPAGEAWPAPLPVADRRRRHWGRWAAGLASAAVVAAGAVLAVRALSGGRHWPAHWDPRVAPIAAFDEAHRGLTFLHPVPVVFLSDTAFATKATADNAPSAQDLANEARDVAELRALGLATGSPDLYQGTSAVVSADVEGFYSFHDKTVWVRGDVMTPLVRVVLAHELVHVLQDQHFGVHEPKTDDASFAYDALVEGDAVRVQDEYLQSLSPADQASYQRADAAAGAQTTQAASALPAEFLDAQQFPYALGPAFVATVAANGTGGLDAAFRNPPRSTAEVIEPSRYLTGGQPVPEAVPAPTLGPGQRRVDAIGTLGAFELYEVLASRADVGTAWAAASTWRGDTAVGYTAGGRTCVADELTIDGDPTTMLGALRAWAAPAASGTVQVRQDGIYVRFDACDPGPQARPAAGVAPRPGALEALGVRSGLGIGIGTATNASPAVQDCAADVVFEAAGNAGVERLLQLAGGGDTTALQQYGRALGVKAGPALRSRCPALFGVA